MQKLALFLAAFIGSMTLMMMEQEVFINGTQKKIGSITTGTVSSMGLPYDNRKPDKVFKTITCDAHHHLYNLLGFPRNRGFPMKY